MLWWLTLFNLLERYPTLYHSLVHGFDVGIHTISKTYVPPNNPSILKHPKIYNEIVENEFQKGRYLGPFSQAKLEALIGPFQSSPLSLVPKPGKPGKFHVVHDFSHPHTGSYIHEGTFAHNCSIEIDGWPHGVWACFLGLLLSNIPVPHPASVFWLLA